MVALVLGLFLTAGVLTVYLGNKQSYRLNEALARLQENARYAFEIMGRDIRMAGYFGCSSRFVSLTNTLNNATGFLWDFGKAVYGYEAISATAWNETLDAAITSPLGNRDIVVIRKAADRSVLITGQPSNSGDCNNSASYTKDLKISSTTGLSVNDIVVATNCSHASVLQITNLNTGNNVVHNTGSVSAGPGNATGDLGACYAGDGQLIKIDTFVYYISNNPANLPSLYRKQGASVPLELVEGVRDMQITYGVDTDNDGAIDVYSTAQTVTNNTQWDKAKSVRVALLLMSVENNVVDIEQTYRYNGADVPAGDRRLYQSFEATFTLRNRVE